MNRIKRLFQIIFSVILISVAALVVKELWLRNTVQYEAGRYFDEEHAVVYHEQVLPFYWIVLLVVVVLFTLIIRWMMKGR